MKIKRDHELRSLVINPWNLPFLHVVAITLVVERHFYFSFCLTLYNKRSLIMHMTQLWETKKYT